MDADAVSGATVSVSNITSVVKATFKYHADKDYKRQGLGSLAQAGDLIRFV